jgi:putative protease
MRIISPVDHLAETESLLEAGADELYGGYVPPEWQASFDLLASLNQRTFAAAQINSAAELQGIVRLTHAVGRRFILTLNAPFYSDAQLPLLLDYLDRVVAIGIDGLILADLGLLRQQQPHQHLAYSDGRRTRGIARRRQFLQSLSWRRAGAGGGPRRRGGGSRSR